MAMFAGVARAQQALQSISPTRILYCSGVVTDQAGPTDTYVISGEDSSYRITFPRETMSTLTAAQIKGSRSATNLKSFAQ